MTTVYGVTMYGAKLQIAKQLKDIDEYPQEHVNSGAAYLAQKTFESLNEMFTSSQEIQNWFTECATLISDDFLKNVEWNTPLGLYVQQPYFRNINQASVQVVSIILFSSFSAKILVFLMNFRHIIFFKSTLLFYNFALHYF